MLQGGASRADHSPGKFLSARGDVRRVRVQPQFLPLVGEFHALNRDSGGDSRLPRVVRVGQPEGQSRGEKRKRRRRPAGSPAGEFGEHRDCSPQRESRDDGQGDAVPPAELLGEAAVVAGQPLGVQQPPPDLVRLLLIHGDRLDDKHTTPIIPTFPIPPRPPTPSATRSQAYRPARPRRREPRPESPARAPSTPRPTSPPCPRCRTARWRHTPASRSRR